VLIDICANCKVRKSHTLVLNRLNYYKTWSDFRQQNLLCPDQIVKNVGRSSYKNYNPNEIKNVVDVLDIKKE